jgi:acyl-CoA thioesterase-1
MKYRNFLMLLVGACFSLVVGVSRAQNPTVNIMPMGDSVTARGSSPESSYRYWLWMDLTNAGFENIAFVGNQSGVSDGAPANSWPQEAYEGGSLTSGGDGDGWTTGDGVTNANDAATILNSGSPAATIVLLDLGANDFVWNMPLGETETNLEEIIQDFVQANSSTIILLATPTGFVPGSNLTRQQIQQQKAEQSHLAAAMSKVISVEKKAGIHVVKVGLFGGYNPRTDTVDGTHPNIKGEQFIAKKYFNALHPILKKMEKEGL